jgi:hypothetical protein
MFFLPSTLSFAFMLAHERHYQQCSPSTKCSNVLIAMLPPIQNSLRQQIVQVKCLTNYYIV